VLGCALTHCGSNAVAAGAIPLHPHTLAGEAGQRCAPVRPRAHARTYRAAASGINSATAQPESPPITDGNLLYPSWA
jgi:hypothetical protein